MAYRCILTQALSSCKASSERFPEAEPLGWRRRPQVSEPRCSAKHRFWVRGSAAGVAGAGRAGLGEHRGACGCRRGQGWGRAWGRAPTGARHRCSGKECHAASARGLTARSSSGETQPLFHACGFPGTLVFSCTISNHARERPGAASPTEKTTRAVIKARGNPPVLPVRVRQPAAIPAAVARFPHCCPRKESEQRAFAWAAPWESPASGSGAAGRPSLAPSALPRTGDMDRPLVPLARSGWG